MRVRVTVYMDVDKASPAASLDGKWDELEEEIVEILDEAIDGIHIRNVVVAAL